MIQKSKYNKPPTRTVKVPPAWDWDHPGAKGAIPYDEWYERELATGKVEEPYERDRKNRGIYDTEIK